MRAVYGLRIRENHEVRYVGRTYREIDVRLRQHLCRAKDRDDPFSLWLLSNRDKLECFPISHHCGFYEAKDAEREMIGLCLKLGQRLFNRTHVPTDQWATA